MTNFVNSEAFFKWYDSVSADKRYDKDKLLDEVFQQYCRTRKSSFELPAEKTVTGKAETYSYEFEDLGKCGGSALFIYF
ncbi:MAG: hypothetical protein PUB32_04885 [Clostridiales bacterium]|nr:hypothetical protein [Clostridiales bacterium]